MSNFYNLVHPNKNVRLTAARSTYKILQVADKNSEAGNEALNYCVERLVSGLASSRENARNGFGVLLLEILETMQVSFDRLYAIADQKFGNINKDLHRDNILGWFLLINIILKSGIISNKKKNNRDKYTQKIYKTLQQLKKVKNYMEIPICNVLQEYFELFVDYIPQDLPRSILASDTKVSTYSMFLALIYNKHKAIPDLMALDKAEFPLLTTVIMDATAYKPQSHPVVYLLNEFILKNKNESFDYFFNQVIQPAYFIKDHTDLAGLGLNLINQLIKSEYSNQSNVKTLVNDYIVRTCIMHTKDKTARLYKATYEFLNNLVDYFKENTLDSDSLKVAKQHAILECLTESPGSLAFDEDSNTSIVAQLILHSSKEVLKKYVLKLQNTLLSLEAKNKTEIRIKRACIKQLAHIVKRPQFSEETAIIQQLSHFLILHSFFRVNCGVPKLKLKHLENIDDEVFTKPINSFDDTIRQSFKQTLYIVIDQIVSFSNTSLERYQRIDSLITYANTLMRLETDDIEYICPKDEEYQDVLKRWKKYVRKSKSFAGSLEQGTNIKELHAILLLYHFYGLQILEHGINVNSELNDLVECFAKAANGDHTEPIWADVITDLLIGMLSSTEFMPVFRKIAETIFTNIIPHLTQSSIESICLAIADTEACNEEDSDGPMPSDNGDDSDVESSRVSPMEVDSDKNQKVKSESTSVENTITNGKPATDEDHKTSEMSEDGSDNEAEVYMDDEQMLKFDDTISELFKLKRITKSSNDEKSKHQLNLRLRCLDLAKKVVSKKVVKLELVDNLVKSLIPLTRLSTKNAANRPVSDKVLLMLKKSPYRSKNERIKALFAPKTKNQKNSKDKSKKKSKKGKQKKPKKPKSKQVSA